jgi:hypothetical protein
MDVNGDPAIGSRVKYKETYENHAEVSMWFVPTLTLAIRKEILGDYIPFYRLSS